ncbi:hypothetical protein [Streptomyces sp. NPDC056600]|uniref:hypothetical protein n=1 Tax=Streptomyces sp. NPDC056600 TaxID=3345874 RepID=UPI00367DE1C9
MSKFLEVLGGKLAERWLGLLLGPSVLLVTVAAVGTTLGQRNWHDTSLLLDRLDHLAAEPALRTAGPLVFVLAGLLACSAALGLSAVALGTLVERLWLARRPRCCAELRRRRWDAARRDFERALVEAARAEGTADAAAAAERARELNARRNRIGLVPPAHPFWLGDRITAVDTRVWEAYRLDLVSVWPRIWLMLPEDARAEIGTARTRLAAAARLVVWSAGYLLVGVAWWPAAVAGVVTALVARRRARVAGVAFAELAEAAVDLHGRALAESLGVACEARLTREIGAEITTLLRKHT